MQADVVIPAFVVDVVRRSGQRLSVEQHRVGTALAGQGQRRPRAVPPSVPRPQRLPAVRVGSARHGAAGGRRRVARRLRALAPGTAEGPGRASRQVAPRTRRPSERHVRAATTSSSVQDQQSRSHRQPALRSDPIRIRSDLVGSDTLCCCVFH